MKAVSFDESSHFKSLDVNEILALTVESTRVDWKDSPSKLFISIKCGHFEIHGDHFIYRPESVYDDDLQFKIGFESGVKNELLIYQHLASLVTKHFNNHYSKFKPTAMSSNNGHQLTNIDFNDITNIQNYLNMDFSNFPVKEFKEIVCHGDEDINNVIVIRHDLGFQDDFGSFILVGIMGEELFDIENKMGEILEIRNSDVIKMTVPLDCWDESHHKESNLFNKLRSRINEYREHLIQFERLVPSEDVEEDDLSLKIAELEKQLEILKAAQAIVNKR